MRLAGILACLLSLTSCFSYSFAREERLIPIPEGLVDQLSPGASMDECLELLGAPLYLWEYRGSGVALAWGSLSRSDHGFSLSIPIGDKASGSVNFNNIDNDFKGIVLVFDSDLRLLWIRRGYLHEIARESRRPAAYVEE